MSDFTKPIDCPKCGLNHQSDFDCSANSWQPIETAPIVPDQILVHTVGGEIKIVEYEDINTPPYWVSDDDTAFYDEHLTHWMPLPDPPTKAIE